MIKTMNFNVVEVTTGLTTEKYIDVCVETNRMRDVPDNFTPDEIIAEYSELEELYQAMKKFYGED